MKWKILTLFVVSFVGFQCLADELPETHPNPYVDLYLQRTIEAKEGLNQAIAEQELAAAKFEMARRLKESGAVSLEEYLEKKAALQVAVTRIARARTRRIGAVAPPALGPEWGGSVLMGA